jgi:phytanoyl-CoA hydroxylase
MNIELLRFQYESVGFLHLPGIIDAQKVDRTRTAFDAAAAAYHDEWQRNVKQGRADSRFCDIPNILDQDEVFVDLVDLPELVPLLLSLVGPDVQLNHTHARLFPPGKTFTALWHSDLADVIGIDLPHSTNFFMKIHYFFEDLRPDQGCLAFIPGSHRFPPDIPRPVIDDPFTSPLTVKVVPKAGDVVIFNTHLLHMALDNDSPLVRKSLIYAYSHFWVKHYANGVPTDLDKYATTPLRRQLFGVEEEGVAFFDQRYDGRTSSQQTTSFRAASKRLVKRILKTSSITWKKK